LLARFFAFLLKFSKAFQLQFEPWLIWKLYKAIEMEQTKSAARVHKMTRPKAETERAKAQMTV
jgi:hypothetical protein